MRTHDHGPGWPELAILAFLALVLAVHALADSGVLRPMVSASYGTAAF